MIWPSGFRLGTRTKITLSRIFFTCGELSVASRCTSSDDHLRRADLGRVDRRGDHDHDLALPEDLVALGVGRRAPLEVELPLHLLVAIQVLQRVGAGDLERDERIAVGRLPELAEADAIRRARHLLEVVDDLVPARQLVVGPHPEPEELLRRLDAAGCAFAVVSRSISPATLAIVRRTFRLRRNYRVQSGHDFAPGVGASARLCSLVRISRSIRIARAGETVSAPLFRYFSSSA